jgi:hypothetical protein
MAIVTGRLIEVEDFTDLAGVATGVLALAVISNEL